MFSALQSQLGLKLERKRLEDADSELNPTVSAQLFDSRRLVE
jgi:hypothetical protein